MDGSLLFPTGSFSGVYFSAEVDYYVTHFGYKAIAIQGYHFPESSSAYPFSNYVNTLYNKRLEAKASKNTAMDFLYKHPRADPASGSGRERSRSAPRSGRYY
jgi:hypothetical protein